MSQAMPIPENPFSASLESMPPQGSGPVDDDTRIDIARALGKHYDAYEEVFGPEERTHKTTRAVIRTGHNYTIPLGDHPYAETSRYLFINKVKPLKRDRGTLRCQMTLISIGDEGDEVIEESDIYFFKKGEAVFAFGKDIEDHIDKTRIGKRAAVAGLVVTIAGVAVEESVRRHRKHKKQK